MVLEDLKTIWPEWQIQGNCIGKGSFATVYQAVRENHSVKSYAAIKVINIPTRPDLVEIFASNGMGLYETKTYLQGFVNQFIQEIQLMESLKGTQNIVSVEDYQVVEKKDGIGWTIYIRMELLTPLSQYFASRPIKEKEVIRLGCDICSALELCSKLDILHRDIKPGNILVHNFGYFKLGDFGVSRTMKSMTNGLSQNVGTPDYMAPEVVHTTQYDTRADIYSLGLVLYQLLNHNRLPFWSKNKQQLSYQDHILAISRRINGEPLPSPCQASPAMAAVILRACAFQPEERFATATEFKQALQAVTNGTNSVDKTLPSVQTVASIDSMDKFMLSLESAEEQQLQATVKVRNIPKWKHVDIQPAEKHSHSIAGIWIRLGVILCELAIIVLLYLLFFT